MSDKSAHLLIVDDEESIRSSLRRVLRRDYELSFAASAAEALALLKTMERRPDVILSDHLMPEMTGLDFLKRCRLLYPEIGRVILTGQAEMQMVISAINEGAVLRFLTKPWDDDELKLTLYMVVDQLQSAREAQQRRAAPAAAPEPDALEPGARELDALEAQHPGLTQLTRDADGAIDLSADLDEEP
ncbi:MAG: response regulator [Deltaproteobacteria bacterium]|nr:response regulator [Deltaproteobacteria bacterium]